jgi:hypothetical protein
LALRRKTIWQRRHIWQRFSQNRSYKKDVCPA